MGRVQWLCETYIELVLKKDIDEVDFDDLPEIGEMYDTLKKHHPQVLEYLNPKSTDNDESDVEL